MRWKLQSSSFTPHLPVPAIASGRTVKRCSMLPVSTLIIVSIGYLTKRNHHRLSNRVFFPTEPFSLRALRIEKLRIDPQSTQRIDALPPRRARRPTTAAGRTAAAGARRPANPRQRQGLTARGHSTQRRDDAEVRRGKTKTVCRAILCVCFALPRLCVKVGGVTTRFPDRSASRCGASQR